jgi:hypothetical protein
LLVRISWEMKANWAALGDPMTAEELRAEQDAEVDRLCQAALAGAEQALPAQKGPQRLI